MDQVNAALNANLNILVIVTLMMLSISMLLLVGAAWTLIPQVHRTLFAIQKLATTVETELEPTLNEANKLLGGVLRLQDLAQQGVAGMSTKVEDVTGNLGKVADVAMKNTEVLGVGLAAAIKAYLHNPNDDKDAKTENESAGQRRLTKGPR